MPLSQEAVVIEHLFRIPNKDGIDVDFILNPEQRELDETLTGRDIIPKARQMGVSTYFLGRYLAKCLSQRNRRCVVISHETDATQRLLGRVHYMLKHIKGPAAVLRYSNRNEIQFEKTDSTFYIGTAGAKNFGHGDTITDLHCSEVARWPDPGALLKGLFQAVPPSGSIAIESTGDGVGNWYHRACVRAQQGIGYKLHFLNWLNRPEYRLRLSLKEAAEVLADLQEDLEEPYYHEVYGLTPEQLAWRRLKLAELDYDLHDFKEQYPCSLEECFQATGHSIFAKVNYRPTKAWHQSESGLFVLGDHPHRDRNYVIGADVGSGVGSEETNYSVASIWCLEDEEEVGLWRRNDWEPDSFGHKLAELGELFNTAYINVERNNHGILTISELLKSGYPRGAIHRGKESKDHKKEYGRIADFGTFTSEVTRALVIGNFRKEIQDRWTIHSPVLKGEMDTFIEKENGKQEAQDGCFDDCVMAAAQALFVVPRAATRAAIRYAKPKQTYSDPFALDTMLEELELRAKSEEAMPIRHQADLT